MISIAGNEKLEWVLFIIADALIIALAYYDKVVYDWGPAGEVDAALLLLAMALMGQGMYFYTRYVFRQGSHKAMAGAFQQAVTGLEPVQTIPGVKNPDTGKWIYPPMGVWEMGISFPMLAVRSAIILAPLYMARAEHGVLFQLGKFHAYEGDDHYRLPPHVLTKLSPKLFALGDTRVWYPAAVDDFVAVRDGDKWVMARDAVTNVSVETEEQKAISIHRHLEEYSRTVGAIRTLGGSVDLQAFTFGGEKDGV